MDTSNPSMRDLAQRLLAANRAAVQSVDASGDKVHDAILMTDRLRRALIKFAGQDGFATLLRRALVMASVDVPALKDVKVNSKGDLEGLPSLGTHAATPANSSECRTNENGEAEAAIAITTHLLNLLVIFVGEPLTLRLVRDTWPDASPDTPTNIRSD